MSQADDILRHLKSGVSITPLAALNLYGCFRLAARIDELRHAGHPIETEIVHWGKKRYASYSLAEVQAEMQL